MAEMKEEKHNPETFGPNTETDVEPNVRPGAEYETRLGIDQDNPPAFYDMSQAARPDGKKWIKYPPKPPVKVLLQPEEKHIEIVKAKTARAVLTALGLRECTALVVRDGELLTPDRQVLPGDSLLVRKVTSSG